MKSLEWTNVKEGFVEVIGSEGSEGNAGGGNPRYSVKAVGSDVTFYQFDVEVADYFEGVWKTWDDS